MATVDEAELMYPPNKVERLATSKVDEALRTPDAWKFPATVEDAEEMKPPTSEESESVCKVE